MLGVSITAALVVAVILAAGNDEPALSEATSIDRSVGANDEESSRSETGLITNTPGAGGEQPAPPEASPPEIRDRDSPRYRATARYRPQGSRRREDVCGGQRGCRAGPHLPNSRHQVGVREIQQFLPRRGLTGVSIHPHPALSRERERGSTLTKKQRRNCHSERSEVEESRASVPT